MGVGTLRRYYTQKAEAQAAQGEGALAAAFAGKLAETPGTPLPEEFPALVKLTAAGYMVREDLTGATAEELRQRAGLTAKEAKAVLAAVGD